MHTSTCIYLHTHAHTHSNHIPYIYSYICTFYTIVNAAAAAFCHILPSVPLRHAALCYVTFFAGLATLRSQIFRSRIRLPLPPAQTIKHMPAAPSFSARTCLFFFNNFNNLSPPSAPTDKSYVAHGHVRKGGEVRLRHTHTHTHLIHAYSVYI